MLKIKQKQQLKQKMSGTAMLEPHRRGAPIASLPYSPDCRSPQQSPQQRHVHPGRRPPAPNAPPLLPPIRPCHNPMLQKCGLMHSMPDVSFSHTKLVSRAFLEGGVRQSILGPPPVGIPVCGSQISTRESSVHSLDRKKENVLNIAGKSHGQMKKTSTDSDMGKVGTVGQIQSSVPEQAEPPLKKHRGLRTIELGEESTKGDKIQQPPKSNSASVSDHEVDDNSSAQLEEDSVDQNRAAEGVGTSLKVTIQRSSESRAFSTSPEEMAAGVGHDGDKERSKHTVKFTCHICNVTCPDQQGFQSHMISLDHQQRMMEIQHVSNTCLATLLPQTQESLQGTNRERRMGHQRWCPTCQCRFSGDLIEHRRTKKHKTAKVSSRPFCTLCERHFRTPRKFVEHMKSPEHKHRVEELRNEGDPEVMEELITVDAIGCFEGEDDYEEDRNEEEVAVFEKHPAHRETALEGTTNYETYDPDTQYGTSFVVPVAGFLCKLCHKFYHFESSARETHCRSLKHFQNLQKHNTLKMQKNCESDASCSSSMGDPRGLELIASCAGETMISDSSQADLNRLHINSSRKHLHSRKLKPSKRAHKSKTLLSKISVAPQNPSVVMKHLICTPHCGSRSGQESHCQESNRPDSSVQLQQTESGEKEKTSCDPVHYSEELENVNATPTFRSCHVLQLNSEENVTKPFEVKETVSKDQTKNTLHVHKSPSSVFMKTVKKT
ncbi:cdkn1a interacting zinc finger protein 1b isoform X3 [Chanodichthys erythropterus]|uniref:cdkn1a interacting zinc finger protein 1b isoform X3 n=1 Tax=Chanodichthys erythropterus TaxID=933992 RepID=UPI00351F29D1